MGTSLFKCFFILVKLLIIWGIVPLFAGRVLVAEKNSRLQIEGWVKAYCIGWGITLALYEGVYLVCFFLHFKLNCLTGIWGICCVLLAIWGVRHSFKNDTGIRIEKKEKEKKERILFGTFWGLVLLQIILVTLATHVDMDDALYAGIASSTYETGTLFEYNPYTGYPLGEWGSFLDYELSPAPIYWATIAAVLKLHPLIVMHTIWPPVAILIFNMIHFLIGKKIWGNENNKIYVFLIAINVLSLCGNFSFRSVGAFLLLRSWQGKAIWYTIMLPLFLYVYLLWRETRGIREWIMAIAIVIASCMTSSSAVFLLPIMIAACALFDLLSTKSISITLRTGLFIIPNGVILMIYYMIRTGIWCY